MRKILVLLAAATLTACGGGGGSGVPQTGTDECTNSAQKEFVLRAMRDWYFWNDRLPANVDVNSYATPEDVVDFLTTFSPPDSNGNPVDSFSFIRTAEEDQASLGAGEFEGYGVSFRYLAADDVRFVRVFPNGPAAAAGLARGQRILELNGRTIAEIDAAEGVSALLATSPVEYFVREPNGNEFRVTVAREVFIIDPIPQHRIIPVAGTPGVGYMEMVMFSATADAQFDTVFGDFAAAGVTDVIIDFRSNGGGLVSTAELLGDYIGGAMFDSQLFSETRFNADRAADNNSNEFFELRGNSINLSRLYIIANSGTASAPELVTNSLDFYSDVIIVGDDTRGKPVGQVGILFCDQILRPTSFQTVNAGGFGDYFDGLPADCPVVDDLNIPIGADQDPHVLTALGHSGTGSCPTASLPGGINKAEAPQQRAQPERRSRPMREYLDAY